MDVSALKNPNEQPQKSYEKPEIEITEFEIEGNITDSSPGGDIGDY